MKEPPRRPAPPLPVIYRALYRAWGPQHWWPGRTRLEVIVGAVLTQNTAWGNVEQAIRRLRKARALSWSRLARAPESQIAQWIRPAGYFRVKARRLRALITTVGVKYGGPRTMWRMKTPALRSALLKIHGVGPETADSILLYAAGRPVFVVDAYTRRFLRRHGWISSGASYADIARWFTSALPSRAPLFNEFHALIVRLGKMHCRSQPRCEGCPLAPWLPRGGPRP